ncbi:ribulose-phosphate 3-epimerase [Aerococcus urinaeequi]|uniref:ribulose-phosphate 3-epimerase n=1 Tax=Aerococcus urinaeequi TaxID=51665 RepID=UPI00084627AE|nr:ribulose-phosphate 3-epimerase [Aerococcus urinaeequi]
MKQLVASIMTADQLNLKDELSDLLEAGINWLHCDVMDGVFVNNLAMGPYQIERLKGYDELTIDIHLATVNPEHYIDMFGPLKPDYLTFHIETTDNPTHLIERIRSYGSKVGLAFSPETPTKEIEPYLDQVDLVLVMTVNPGFSGQKFNESVLNKLQELTNIFNTADYQVPLIEVDGNIYDVTIKKMENMKVDLFVLGTSALFNKTNQTYNEKADYLNNILNNI